jgi:rhodanese-related sulfurtransferase
MKSFFLAILATISLMANLKEIDEKELLKMQQNGVVVIDIRTPQEWKQRGIIKGAHTIMFFTPDGQADIGNFMFKLGNLIKNKQEPFIIYCAHANRTKTLGKWLTKDMGFSNVYELKGGIEYGWIDKGLKSTPYK